MPGATVVVVVCTPLTRPEEHPRGDRDNDDDGAMAGGAAAMIGHGACVGVVAAAVGGHGACVGAAAAAMGGHGACVGAAVAAVSILVVFSGGSQY
eukprot:COSAG01_NODE_10744_length_2090_cov_6.850326_3_plen_95_part_00